MRSRFRRKSETRRTEFPPEGPGVASSSRAVPLPIVTQQVHVHRSPELPELPPASDFRTSLILPDLTRRFTLLRSVTGDFVNLDDLRNRFAHQRAAGSESQITEEEENMLLDVLRRAHGAALGGSGSKLSTVSESESLNSSVRQEPSYTSFSSVELQSSSTSSTVRQSTQSNISSLTTGNSSSFGSGSSRASKRHSNNLFNAGQMRDMHYMRKSSNRTMSSNRSALSSVTSESTSGSVANALIDAYADSQGRPTTPDNVQSETSENPSPFAARSAPANESSHTVPPDDGLERLRNVSTRLSKQFTQDQIQRISMSLEGVFREIEEEAEDQVLVPRTSMSTQQDGGLVAGEAHKPPGISADDGTTSPKAFAETVVDPTAMNWFVDVNRPSSAAEGPRSPSPYRATSPGPRVPGYIPGMPRPVTPLRNVDLDEVRSHSTTPRAASPTSAYTRVTGNVLPLSASASNLLRQGRASPTPASGRPSSPLSKFQSGRLTPEDRHKSGNGMSDYSSYNSHWRRPSSPLSNNAGGFPSINGSRPGTPSNVTWNVSGGRTSVQNGKPLGRNGTLLGHSRSQSNSSVGPVGPDSSESSSDSTKNTLQSPRPSYISSSSPDNNAFSGPRSKFLSNGSSLPSSSFTGSNESSLDILSTPPSSSFNNEPMTSKADETTNGFMHSKSGILSPSMSLSQVQKNSDNPLYLSPLSNSSSRSSLVSAGSSYHSWEEENGFGAGFLASQDRKEPPWHEITPTITTVGLSYQIRSGSHSQITTNDPETILRQFTGLSKLDLRTIQDKLLEVSQIREKSTDVRSPSALRRRRPSVSQSAHPSRTTSPAPPPITRFDMPSVLDGPVVPDVSLLAGLGSSEERSPPDFDFMESEESESELIPPPPIEEPAVTNSPGRRNKELADVLFGPTEPLPQSKQPEAEAEVEVNVEVESEHEDQQGTEQHDHVEVSAEDNGAMYEPVTPKSDSRALPQADSTQVPQSSVAMPADPVDLMRQVQERTEAAMAQLRRSPQQNRFPSPGSTVPRRKIHPQDISGPLLVQSSTSIDKIPTLPTAAQAARQSDNQRTIKLSFSKRIRNTLRSKNVPNGDEVTPWTNDSSPSPFNSSPLVGNRNLSPSKLGNNATGSTNDLELNSKPANISPPASAGPSLKNFMSRFRNKKGQAEGSSDSEHREHRNGALPAQAKSLDPPILSAPPVGRTSFQLPPVTPLLGRSGSVSQVKTPFAPSLSRQPTETPTIIAPSSPPPSDTGALKQFFEAAQSLGLDQAAVNDLLVRRNTVKSTNSAADSNIQNENDGRPYLDAPRALSPLVPEVFIDRAPGDLGRSTSMRHQSASPIPPRRVMELADGHSGNVRNTILRRTLIFPSGNGSSTDVAGLVRRASKSRKRASALSATSSRSIHDRVPTPPPTRAKRQSQDPSPPMPNLPWINQPGRSPTRYTPDTPVGDPNSPYDSFYDFYAGDRSGSVQSPEYLEPPKTPVEDQLPEMEDGQALEVIELANGETIWSIVNGLRADDAESFYPRRGSFESELSTSAQHDINGGEQLFFKEHVRTGSKGSIVSNPGRRRSQMPVRPETKVFYSSSTQISKLIEQLSRNTEAATFNIKPRDMPEMPAISPISPSAGYVSTPGHSHTNSIQTTSSDRHWTAVEERLEQVEHMLGNMGTAT